MFLLDMSPSTTPGSSSAANTQFLADNIGLRHRLTGSALPSTPPSASGGLWYFVASLVRIATTCRVARLLGASDQEFPGLPGPLLPVRMLFSLVDPLRKGQTLHCYEPLAYAL